jgi:uncharacterized membrane protein
MGKLMTYAIPILLLIGTIAAFFALARRGFLSFGAAQYVLRVLVALPLVASAILLHFMRTTAVASIIPPTLLAHNFLVVLTGIFEIAGAIGLFIPALRQRAAFWIAALMVAIFPANIYAAGKIIDGFRMPGIPVRIAMQVVYILLVLLAGYGIPRRSPDSPQRNS